MTPAAGGDAGAPAGPSGAYDLLVCDLDGTLLDDSMALDPALAEAFRRAAASGLATSLATGRMPEAADVYRDQLGVTAPVIYYNGALVRGGDGGRDLVSLTLPRGVLRRAWTVFSQAPVHPIFYRDDRLCCVERTLPVRRYCEEEGLRVDVVDDPAEFLALGGFVKSLLIGHPKDLRIVREDLTPIVAEHGRLVSTRTDYLEILPVGASKGAALARLSEYLGVPLARTVAVRTTSRCSAPRGSASRCRTRPTRCAGPPAGSRRARPRAVCSGCSARSSPAASTEPPSPLRGRRAS